MWILVSTLHNVKCITIFIFLNITTDKCFDYKHDLFKKIIKFNLYIINISTAQQMNILGRKHTFLNLKKSREVRYGHLHWCST